MLKSQILEKLQKKHSNLSDNDIEQLFNIFIKKITKSLRNGQNIEIRGFGTFCLHTHQSRIARNPKTGEKIALERRNTVHFKPSKELKNRVNNI